MDISSFPVLPCDGARPGYVGGPTQLLLLLRQMPNSVVGLASSVLSLQALFCDPLLRRLNHCGKVWRFACKPVDFKTRLSRDGEHLQAAEFGPNYVQGILQGVGFRPFVFNLVKKLGFADSCLIPARA